MKLKFIIIMIVIVTNIYAKDINIAVAANVSYAIESLKKEFNKLHPDIKVNITLASSGKLTAQIKNHAPYQLFLSANMNYPETLYKENIAITKPKIYAKGTLAIISSKKYDLTRGLKLLRDKKIDKIAIANPKTAPYGKATIEALKNATLYDDIKDKLVYGESISQTLIFALKAADIGIVAKSLLYSPKMSKFKKSIDWIEVDPKLYRPISQGIVILKNAKSNHDVKAFYDFIQSAKAKEILKEFGYITS